MPDSNRGNVAGRGVRRVSVTPGADSSDLLRTIERESPFARSGLLSGETAAELRASDADTLGHAVTILVRQAVGLPVPSGTTAAAAIADLLELDSPGSVHATLDISGLVALYRRLLGDEPRAALRALIVRLLRDSSRDAILASLGRDAMALGARAALVRDLDVALGGPAAAAALEPVRVRGVQRAKPPLPVFDQVMAAPADDGDGGGADNGAPARTPSHRATALAPVPERGARPGSPASPARRGPSPSTYRAYGLLKSDELVLAGRPFPLEVGLAEKPQLGVAGTGFTVPRPVHEKYDLVVHLFADGFDLGPGETWRHTLKVAPGKLYPTVVVHLTPREQAEASVTRDISATFSIGSETLGVATRQVTVTSDPADLDLRDVARTSTGADVSAPTGEPPADLTITIAKGVEPGALLWSVASKWPAVTWPDREVKTDVGQRPETFSKALIAQLKDREGTPRIFTTLQGVGRLVRDEIPDEVWATLKAAHESVKDRPLDALILTAEPYVPWELALVDDVFDDTAPPYLGAQVNVARWVIGSRGIAPDPPRRVDAAAMAVVSGVYDDPNLERLEAAEEEAKQLARRYKATPIEAKEDPVMQVLGGNPPVDLLHFAVHGKYDPELEGGSLYPVEGLPITVLEILGGNLSDRKPFVFLNACEVGEGLELLGNYSGVGPALLEAGASAVVAPLWQVNDDIARRIAISFYKEALKKAPPWGKDDPPGGPAVADLLRKARAGLVTDAAAQSSTYLAYQFYGHPSLRLSWRQADREGVNRDG